MMKRFTTRENMIDQMLNKGVKKFGYNTVEEHPIKGRIERCLSTWEKNIRRNT